MYLEVKNEQINDTNESWNAGALWQTLRLSFASYDELIFRLPTLSELTFVSVLAQGDPISPTSCQAVSHAYWLEFK